MVCADREPYLRALLRPRYASVALVLGLLTIGCGASTGEISGKVCLKGKQLTDRNVMVQFVHPTKGTFTSSLNSDGTYTVSDVPLGEVKIAVSVMRNTKRLSRSVAKIAKKLSPEKQAELDKSAPTLLGFDAAPPPPIPQHYHDPEKSGLTYTVTGGAQTHDIDLK